jgi:hypothetical protein
MLLQRINAETVVYNRRRVKGRTHAAYSEEEHVVVKNFCEPNRSREEMAEVLRVAAEIEGKPPRCTGSGRLLSGLVLWRLGTYANKVYTVTRQHRFPLVYNRC